MSARKDWDQLLGAAFLCGEDGVRQGLYNLLLSLLRRDVLSQCFLTHISSLEAPPEQSQSVSVCFHLLLVGPVQA